MYITKLTIIIPLKCVHFHVFCIVRFRDGDMELMLHRRLLVDDHWGVGEALNEMAYEKGLVARGKHYLLFDFDSNEAHRRTRILANEIYAQPLITFDHESNKFQKEGRYSKKVPTSLPENVNLMTLESISQNQSPEIDNLYLVRFEHLFDIDEHPVLSLPAKISIKDFIEGIFDRQINYVHETTLGGNRFKDDMLKERLYWNDTSGFQRGFGFRSLDNSNNVTPNQDYIDEIELKPMEIRTFKIQLSM